MSKNDDLTDMSAQSLPTSSEGRPNGQQKASEPQPELAPAESEVASEPKRTSSLEPDRLPAEPTSPPDSRRKRLGAGARAKAQEHARRVVMLRAKQSESLLIPDTVYLTARELADLYQISRSWIYHAVADGKIPYVRIGAQIRFNVAEIEAWLRSPKR
jgi:excisionase family DNA binding protein